MKLTKISARNFKGLTFDLDLTAGVILVGANFAGKSARTDAIRLLLLGYLPELGKVPRATFGLASARTMEVRGVFDDGREIWRSWTMKGDSVKSEDNLEENPWFEPEQFPVMLNAETYFALSETERIKYVFGLLPPNSFDVTPVKFVDLLRVALKDRKSEAVEMLLFEVDSAIHPTVRDAGPQVYLEAFLALTIERAKALKSEAVRMDKTVQGLSQLRLGDENVGPGVEVLSDQIAALTRAIADLNEKKARHASAFAQMVKDRDRRRSINAELERIDRSLTGLPALRTRLSQTQEDLDRAKLLVTPETEAALREELSTLKMDLTLALREIADLDSARDTARRQLMEIGPKTQCPYCGATGDGWKALRTGEIESAIAVYNSKEPQLVKTRDGLKAAIADKEGLLARAKESAARRQALTQEEATISREIANTAPAETRAEILREELGRLTPDDPLLTAAVETLQAELNVKTDEARRLDVKRASAAARAAELSRLADAEAARDKATVEKEVADHAIEEIRTIQSGLVAAAFRPLLDSANKLFGEILPTPIGFHEGEIGTWRGGVWVGHRTFSGTEKALTYAAIQLALATAAPFKLMIIDELGRVDAKNKVKVIRRIESAIAYKAIDQFVGIDAGAEVYDALAKTGDLASKLVSIA